MMKTSFLNNFRIRPKVMAVILAGILSLSLLVLLVIRSVSTEIIKTNMFRYLEVTQKEAGKRLELVFDEINTVATRLLINGELGLALNAEDSTYNEKLFIFRDYLAKESENLNPGTNIVIVNNKQEYFMLYDQTLKMMWANSEYDEQVRQSKEIIEWCGVLKDEAGNSYLVMGKKFRNLYTGNPYGSLYFLIPEGVLADVCSQVVPDLGLTFLLDHEDRVLTHPDKKKVGSILFDSDVFYLEDKFRAEEISLNNEDYILAVSALDDNLDRLEARFRAVSLVYEDKLFSALKPINSYVLYIMLVVSVIGVILSTRISFSITKPILSLKEKIMSFGKNDSLSIISTRRPKDELWELEQSFQEMTDRIRGLINRINNEKEIQRELEFVALQAQINPHFLYNTLDAIGWLAKIKKQPDIERLVLLLAKFFRISLHKGDKYITVQEELELVQSYVSIEQIRFPDRFDLSVDIDDDILSCKIPKIILQPVVENSIKHGISAKAGFSHISIEGRLEETDIILTVSDDGVGFNVASALPKQSTSGYGLKNVNERIQLEYGERYGLSITSEPGKGTQVSLRLKMQSPINSST